MRRTSFARMQCSIGRSLEAIGDWWTPLILRDLYVGLDRFDDLAEDLGISRNLLTSRLAHLVDHGLVEHEPYSDHPPRHRYKLTEAGRDLVPVLMALTAWGDRWATPDDGPPVRFEHTTCGKRFVPQVTCSHCGEKVEPDEVRLIPGPGGRIGPGTKLIGEIIAANRG